MTEPRKILENLSASLVLEPGLSVEQLSLLEAKVSKPLPSEIKDLLSYSAGFQVEAARSMTFLKTCATVHVKFEGSGAVELGFLPCAIDLCGDGMGNFWVVDVESSGAWGAVLFVCHDPPVVAIQARDLGTVLSQLLDQRSEPQQPIKSVYEHAADRIWKEDPWLLSLDEAKLSQDHTVTRFANQLSDNFCIVDLRPKLIGSGFSWGKAGPHGIVRRDGSDVVFGVEQKAVGILNRLFSRL